jgi:3-keto-disaccharide hydrolase
MVRSAMKTACLATEASIMVGKLVVGIGLIVLVAGTVRGQDRPNTLRKEEAAEGWTLLFDGKSLAGWETHGTGDWKVENGAMVCGGTTPNWIGTSASFSDFILKLEFRGREKVNSGIFLRSEKEGQPHITGYELKSGIISRRGSSPAAW